jgi:hypothetical protein
MEAPTTICVLSAQSGLNSLNMGAAAQTRRKGEGAVSKPRKGDIEDGHEPDSCREHREDLLDEALEESFPASDPPSVVRPPAKDC